MSTPTTSHARAKAKERRFLSASRRLQTAPPWRTAHRERSERRKSAEKSDLHRMTQLLTTHHQGNTDASRYDALPREIIDRAIWSSSLTSTSMEDTAVMGEIVFE